MWKWIVLLVIAQFAWGQELLINGGFESGVSPWSGAGAVSAITAHRGVQSLRFTPGQGMAEQVVDVQRDSVYKLSAWIYLTSEFTGSDWGGVVLKAIAYDWSHSDESQFVSPGNRPVGQWFQEVITFTATSSALHIQVGMFGGSNWNANFFMDDVSLRLRSQSNMPPVIDQVVMSDSGGSAPHSLSVSIMAHDDDGAVRIYRTEFGDGGSAIGPAVQHTYGTAGIYNLAIRVCDDQGACDSASNRATISDSTPHSIQITSPTSDSVYTTTASSVTLSGTRQGGSGAVFWINERNLQSGYSSAGSSFSITGIPLDYGDNVLGVQSRATDGACRMDRLTVRYIPNGYQGPVVSSIAVSTTSTGQYQEVDYTFALQTVAANIWLPYDPNPPRYLAAGDGISVDAIFTNGNVQYRVPAFRDAVVTRIGDQLVPVGEYRWTVRMSFRETGSWQMSLQATDRMGMTTTPGPAVSVAASSNPGFLKVSAADDRYFEFDNGKPFVGMGYGLQIGSAGVTDAEMTTWRQENVNFTRYWLNSNAPFSDPWCSWATHHSMGNNGYMPNPLLTSEEHYANGDVCWKLGAPPLPDVRTPAMFRGFWDGPVRVLPNKTYRITARVKTRIRAGSGGLVIKTGGWLGEAATQTGIGTVLSDYLKGYNDWCYLVGSYSTTGGQTTIPNLYLAMEAVDSGDVFVDQMTIQEVHTDGSLGGNILSKWNANSHYYLDPLKSIDQDYAFTRGVSDSIYFKIVILEKNDWLLNQFDRFGMLNPADGTFDAPAGTKIHRLYEYYWRHLIARWGWATSIHSYELVNEGAPGSYRDLTDDLCDYLDSNGAYPRMATTSFWSSWVPSYWAVSRADYADVHAYVMTTGWIDTVTIDGEIYNRTALKEDAAAAVYAYSMAVGNDPQRTKPVVIAETDLDMPDSQTPDPRLAQDTAGVWLHDFIWGHINSGGATAFLFNNANIQNGHLQRHFRPFHAFMSGIPLTNGQYVDAHASVSNPLLRAWGQKQTSGNAAHLWVHHKNHNWVHAIAGTLPAPVSGTLYLTGMTPGAALVESWSTNSPVPYNTDTLWVDNSGELAIDIAPLSSDRAFRIGTLSPASDVVYGLTVGVLGDSVILRWQSAAGSYLFTVYAEPVLGSGTPQLIGSTESNSYTIVGGAETEARQYYFVRATAQGR